MEWLTKFAATDFGKVLLTAVGTLIITGFGIVIGGAKDIFTDWWKRRRQVRYHAMLLAVTLDQLIDDCTAVAFDDGYPDTDGVQHPTAPNPKIEWPSQLDWTLIPSKMMYRCLLLPGMVKSAEESASFIAENVSCPPDYDEYFEELQDRFSKIGLAAVTILDELKQSYDVEHQDRAHSNPKSDFEGQIKKIEKSRGEEHERQRKFMNEMHVRASDSRYDAVDPDQTMSFSASDAKKLADDISQ
ncbi:hypothetical protein AAIH70_26935 [Neorhizobium sp. BT27B]|uniref:hypothetical protein n=1 Tax=Neorhizobium sp. BT27B TaxID=3142625 RepID=UPI003D2ABD56